MALVPFSEKCAEPKTSLVTRADKRARHARNVVKQRLAAYRLAEFRDGMRCRACARKLVRTMTVQPNKLEHHHINGRQVANAEETKNIVCLCLNCHQDRHVRRTLHISGNADGTLVFARAGHTWRG